MEQALAQLNPSQKKAVQHIHGRVLLLAGAGSGKTLVLTMRMAYLIKHHLVSPKSILGLTFTNKAAEEMRQRLSKLVDPQLAKQVTLCTFHSFCMQVLRQDIHRLGYTKDFSLYDEQDIQRLVKVLARDLLDTEGKLPSLGRTMETIQQAKNQGIAVDQLPASGNDWHDDFAHQLYQKLQTSLRAYNALDFDHLLTLTVDLFDRFPLLLENYQDRYKYLMIDEYQDTNPIQNRLATQLSSKHNHLCVVGDDDQSIYGWRGADVSNIIDFKHDVIIKLEQNYRSTNSILKGANAVIQKNQKRHSKVLWSEKGEGDFIEIFFAPNEINEAEAVVKRILKIKEELRLEWKDFAILYRSNALSSQFELALMKETWKYRDRWIQGIPFQVFGGTEFFERREVKDIGAYLRVMLNPKDQEALLRVINHPRRGIGEETLDLLTSENRKTQRPLWDILVSIARPQIESEPLSLHAKSKRGILEFVTIIEETKKRFESQNSGEAVRWLVDRIEYQRAIKEDVQSEKMRELKWKFVQEFIAAIEDFDREQGEHKDSRSLSDFLSRITLDQKKAFASKSQGGEDKLSLMTFHSAKGLEFPVCFLVGVEDHIIPHEKSVLQTGIEEERRLMYVAMTRAKKNLIISLAQRRQRMGKEEVSRPSRFLFEIPQELIKTTDWRLTH